MAMTELEKAESAIMSIRSYLMSVKRYEIKLRNDMLSIIAATAGKVSESLAVKDDKKNIKHYLNLARVIQNNHNRRTRLKKLDLLERILAEDDDYQFSRQAISKIEMHSKLVIEGMRNRRNIYYSPEDIEIIVKGVPKPSQASQSDTEITVEEEISNQAEDVIEPDYKEMGKKILSFMTTTQIPDFIKNPPPPREEEEEKEKENKETNGEI